ncbi:MAG: hypothetical protein AAF512_03955 [Pseudomonadota bacterium]
MKKDRRYYLRRLGKREWTIGDRFSTALLMLCAGGITALLLWFALLLLGAIFSDILPNSKTLFWVVLYLPIWLTILFIVLGFLAPEMANQLVGKCYRFIINLYNAIFTAG